MAPAYTTTMQRWLRAHVPSSVLVRSNAAKQEPVLEPHFTPEQVGRKFGLSANTIRALVENEPVVRIKRRERMHKGRYTTIRIPQSVVDKLYRKLTGGK